MHTKLLLILVTLFGGVGVVAGIALATPDQDSTARELKANAARRDSQQPEVRNDGAEPDIAQTTLSRVGS